MDKMLKTYMVVANGSALRFENVEPRLVGETLVLLGSGGVAVALFAQGSWSSVRLVTDDWQDEARILMKNGEKIKAIKLCRAETGMTLKSAKEACEELAKEIN